jgi:putative endonuclease
VEYVYVLKSLKKNYTYVGITNNLRHRLHEHNRGKNRSTKAYCPFELVKVEEFADKDSARAREKFLKSGKGREYLRKYLCGSAGGG